MMPMLSGHQPETPRQSPRPMGTCRNSKTNCDGAKTVLAATGDSQPFCDVAKYVWEHAIDCQRLSESLLLVPRRYWHRRRPSLSILLVPRRFFAPSQTVWDSPEGALTVWETSGTFW
ncbi:hypothetical protein DPMN_008264 [Dreissena polymorpha]|uniref:Uncharacterized protein n=1 Tax=Dreissena polymorpha TaxID=45954 RepID=A0A9D4MVS9_DREPO|nr:hypothetical protein DPMN_008264 [Dreissena polymorpha]